MSVTPSRVVPTLIASALLTAVVLAASANGVPGAPVSEEQVERGRSVYAQACAVCHGANLEGMAHFPALDDARFRDRWSERTLGELYVYVHDEMPLGAGGSLTDEEYVDVTVYMLERNGVEPGDTAFDPDDEDQAALPLADLW